jgi:hypothetical protein
MGGDPPASALLHEIVDPADGVLLALGSQVEVEHGGLQRAMAEVLLDQAEADAGLEQMGRVASAA